MASELETCMQLAFARESASAARNRLYTTKAKKDGQSPHARLLSALARGEEISARRSLIYLRGKISRIEDHLAALQAAKQTQAREIYPRDRGIATAEGDKSADAALDQIGKVNANHARRLAQFADGGIDDPYYVCQVCGYIAVAAIPEKCPICEAVAERFKEEPI